MRRICFIFVLLILILIGCTEGPARDFQPSPVEEKQVTLEKQREITLSSRDTSDIADPLTHFAINRDATRLAFYDIILQHFVVTDGQGRLLHVLGGPGRGPEEFIQAINFAFDEHDNLLIYDERLRQLKIFGPEGTLKRTSNLFETGELAKSSSQTFVRDSTVYLGITEMALNNTDEAWKSKMMAAFDYQGNLQALYGSYDPYVIESPYYGDSPEFYVGPEAGTLYATQTNSYRIQLFDLASDRRTHYFGRRSPHYRESEEEIDPFYSHARINEMTLNQSFANGIYVTSVFIIYPFQNTTEEWFRTRDQQYQEQYIVLYDRQSHAFNAELKLPHPMGTVAGDRIYLIENSNPDNYTIGVYELQSQ